MKWLKMFEDFGDKVIELEMDSYYDMIKGIDFDSFTDYESRLIIELLDEVSKPTKVLKWEHPIDSPKFGKSEFNIVISKPNKIFRITILKKEDSWFLVHIISTIEVIYNI